MKIQYAKKLKIPEEPGVYIFRSYNKRPLYIGRATFLRDRILSYFSSDLIESRGPRIVDMVTKAKYVTWIRTASVLEAVLLEISLIKKYQPYYNVDERDDKSSQYVIITGEEWPRVFLVRARDHDKAKAEGRSQYKVRECFGPFVEIALIKESLKILRRLFPFRDKKSDDPRHERFYRSLGRSPLDDTDDAHERYMDSIRYITLFFRGQSDKARKMIAAEMRRNVRHLDFEKAEENKRLLDALGHIHDIALLKRDGRQGTAASGFRIEAYDVAHLSGTNVVGSMAVTSNGQPATGEYRRFKISREANDDLAGLAEIISRRLNHSEWDYPDLIVVDGDERHAKVARSILESRRINIGVVAVKKDESHKASQLLGDPEIIAKYGKEIVATNAEAHRFAIAYHRLKRRIV